MKAEIASLNYLAGELSPHVQIVLSMHASTGAGKKPVPHWLAKKT